MLEAGRDAGLLAFDDAEAAFRTFFGLVGRDVQIRLLLGDRFALTKADIARDADASPPDSFSPSTQQPNRTADKAGDQH